MDTLETLRVRRVAHSEDLLVAGDYVFIAARPPMVVTESIPLALRWDSSNACGGTGSGSVVERQPGGLPQQGVKG